MEKMKKTRRKRGKKRSKIKKGELVKTVILAMGTVALTTAAVGVMAAMPGLAVGLNAIMEVINKDQRGFSQTQVRRSLKYLEKKKLISLKEADGELLAKFREKGKEVFYKYKIDELEIKKPKRWDGKWRIVIFDIPEKKRLARDVLRNKLKELGFYQLQRSVFVHPFECQREIELIKEVYETSPYTYYLEADFVDREARLRRHFEL